MRALIISFLLLLCTTFVRAGEPVNINTADKAALETVRGIGPALAQRILDYRTANGPFRSLKGLEKVSGIGPATLEKMKPYLTVTEAAQDKRLDINTATAAQLEELPGIGEVLSKRIVDYRKANGPFRRVADLEKVNGLSATTIEKFSSMVRVDGPEAVSAAGKNPKNSKVSSDELRLWEPKR